MNDSLIFSHLPVISQPSAGIKHKGPPAADVPVRRGGERRGHVMSVDGLEEALLLAPRMTPLLRTPTAGAPTRFRLAKLLPADRVMAARVATPPAQSVQRLREPVARARRLVQVDGLAGPFAGAGGVGQRDVRLVVTAIAHPVHHSRL